MSRRPSIRARLILLLMLATSASSAADEASVDVVTIDDGSVLRGKIKRVEDDKLILDTGFAGDVQIKVGQIVDVTSDQLFSVALLSGEIISGYLAVSNGKIVLRDTQPTPGEPPSTEEPGAREPIELPTAATAATPMAPAPESDAATQQTAATPTAPTPEPDVVAQQPAATEGAALQRVDRDDLPQDEQPAEAEEPSTTAPADIPAATEPTAARRIAFGDVDWIRVKPPYFRYHGNLNGGVQLARGNTDTTDLHFDAHLEPSFGWNTLRFTGEYDKQTADGDTTTNRWKAGATYERTFRRRWFVSASNTYESDTQRDLDLRIVASSGVGYRFFDTKTTFLSVLPGLAYVHENFAGSEDDDDYVAGKLETDLRQDLYKDEISFFNRNTYLNNLQDLKDIILETRTGLRFDMPWDLKLSAVFEADWDNEPAMGTKKLDTRYMLKLGFEFSGDEEDWVH